MLHYGRKARKAFDNVGHADIIWQARAQSEPVECVRHTSCEPGASEWGRTPAHARRSMMGCSTNDEIYIYALDVRSPIWRPSRAVPRQTTSFQR
jgi:hypothetical protein